MVRMGFGSVAMTGPTSRPLPIVTFAHVERKWCGEKGIIGKVERDIYIWREKKDMGREMGGDNAPLELEGPDFGTDQREDTYHELIYTYLL